MEVLKKSLAKNGLPVTGTKPEMLARLLSGTTDKRKSAGKKTAAVDEPDDTSDVADSEYTQFANAERQNLEASGITNEEDIEEEVARRWKVLKSLKPTPKAEEMTVSADVKVLPILLDDKQLAALDYIYVGPTKTGEHMYGVKKPAPAPADSPPAKLSASPAKKAGVAKASGSKRKIDAIKPEPEPESESQSDAKKDDTPDMEWACKITEMRILKKLKKENMVLLCNYFGVPSKGSPEQLAEQLAVQFHYETDDE